MAGRLAAVVELSVVLDVNFEFVVFLDEGEEEEELKARGVSFDSRKSVSAATMPPIEWPIRTV